MGRIAVVKMKILPRFLFIFQNLIVRFSEKLLQQIHGDKRGNKPRIESSVLQQEVGKGGLAVSSNIELYYHAVHLLMIVQWWIPNSRINWMGEQLGFQFPCWNGFYYGPKTEQDEKVAVIIYTALMKI